MTTVDDRTPTVADVSGPSRLAEPDEAISAEELQLAARNHGIPLEALRYDVTPAGLHYLLIHYDIPDVDPAAHTLTIGGAVDRPLTVTLADLRERPRVTQQVTLECAGNGRALLHPRPVSQPWLVEAVGNAEWTGTPLAPLLREAGLGPDAVDVVFTGADHGVERGVEQDYQRALPVADALREEVLLAYEMNGAPLLPQHGAPLRLIVPGWYGMAHVKWLQSVEMPHRAVRGLPERRRVPGAHRRRRPGRAGHPDRAPRAGPPARLPRLHVPPPGAAARAVHGGRSGLVGARAGGRRGGDHRRRAELGAGRAGPGGRRRLRLAAVALRVVRHAGPVRARCPGDRRVGADPAGRAAVEPWRLRQQPGAAGRGRGAGRSGECLVPAE